MLEMGCDSLVRAWLLAGMLAQMFASELKVSATAHHKLRVFALVCVLISVAIYSMRIPLRHILREKKD